MMASGAEYKPSRVAIGALQGKTVSVPLSVSMTAASDTGISNSDGITKNRSPQVSGVAMPSATVTLYANNQIVGSTIVASNGQWSVTSQELADGTYDLLASIQTVQGAVIQQKIKTITIDTAAPQIASVTGLMDGVAWDASDVFSGLIRDADNQSKLEYWANDGEKQAISLNSNLEFGNTSLNLISNLTKNAEHKLYLKAIDRAGNEMQYDYSFMRLNLPGLLDDANWIDPVSPGEPDNRQPGSGGTGGNNPGDGTGRYYIGVGGGWGYASGSGGTGWTAAPSGFSDNPPVPNLPGQDPNQQLTYLEALNVILDTAIDALSKHTTVASKKSILQGHKTSLLGIGKLVEVYGLHSQMKTMLNSLFKLGYDPTDNRVSRQEAVRSGWAFAKSVALDTVSLKLKSFESQVYGIVRGMMAKNGLTVTAAQETQLQGTIGLFARRYAVLTPVGASYRGGENYYTSGFTQIAWTENWNYGNALNNSSVNTTDPYYIALTSGKPSEANGWFGLNTAEFLQETLSGLNTEQIIAGFENAQVLINGATRSAPLWRDGYQNVVAVRDGGLLQELIDTGFELVRVGATNPTAAAAEGAWLEAVLEKDVVKVAGGLSQFVRGFEGTHNNPGYLYTRDYIDALDYGQRLMRVAAAVDDPILDAEVLKADFLSELVNLGGAYAALAPTEQQISLDEIVPLHSVLIKSYFPQQSMSNSSSVNLTTYFQGIEQPRKALQRSIQVLREFKRDSQYASYWSDSNWINLFLTATRPYEASSLVDNDSGFTLVGSFERSLTSQEIKYLRDTFGNSIDYSKIKITRGNWQTFNGVRDPLAKTIGNTIHLIDQWGGSIFQQDGNSLTAKGLILLAHEVTHAWQWQNGGFAYAPDSMIAQASAWLRSGNYNNAYDWQEAHRKGIAWERWNPEQQAKALEDYNRTIQDIYRGDKGSNSQKLLRTLTPYVLEVRQKQGAPTYNDLLKYINIVNDSPITVP